MSFRGRQALRLRPVNSIKHVVDIATTVTGVLVSSIQVIKAVDNPSLSVPNEVNTGSTVGSIYLRVEVQATDQSSTEPRLYMTVQKDPGGNLAIVNPNAVGVSDNKKFVIHQEMVMVGSALEARIPRTMFIGVVKIPPRLKRFGVRDELSVNFQNGVGEGTADTQACIQCIYKEFR